MSGNLTHSPAQIIRQLLIDLSLGSDGGTWPVYTELVDTPDDCIAVINQAGFVGPRHQHTGGYFEKEGIQILVRGQNSQKGFTKAQAIKNALTTQVRLTQVAVTDDEQVGTAQETYLVTAIQLRSGPFKLLDPASTGRRIWSLNFTANLQQIA